jgi:AGZA family xanthine/uracil permease-like MFS transporter
MKQAIDQIFKLSDNNTTIKREFLAGFTTFITMAYIIFVNPQIMSESGMDQGAIFVGTCLAASIACLFMGLFANWPVGLGAWNGIKRFLYLHGCRSNGICMGSCIGCSLFSWYLIFYHECY